MRLLNLSFFNAAFGSTVVSEAIVSILFSSFTKSIWGEKDDLEIGTRIFSSGRRSKFQFPCGRDKFRVTYWHFSRSDVWHRRLITGTINKNKPPFRVFTPKYSGIGFERFSLLRILYFRRVHCIYLCAWKIIRKKQVRFYKKQKFNSFVFFYWVVIFVWFLSMKW